MRKVLILDTSILCVWLEVPGKETCGKAEDLWDKPRLDAKINKEDENGSTFVLPIATIIETGNHISQAKHSRFELANKLADLMKKSADNESPWAAFSEQGSLWAPDKLKQLADEWPKLAAEELSIGDTTIKNVADYYNEAGAWDVEILTGDSGLKSYEPHSQNEHPRRRKK